MKYPVYPVMKDSGIEWLGEIPKHWEINDLKWLLKLNDGGIWGEEADDSKGTIILRSTEINLDGSWSINEPAIRKVSTQEFERYKLKEGDLLITKSSGSEKHIGKTAFVTKNVEKMECAYSNFMQRLRPKNNIDSKYLFYFINGSVGRDQLFYYSNTTTGLRNLSSGIIAKIDFTVPTLNEQQAIANFLDKETGRIDKLIDKKEKLIELLEEKKQAIIGYAVTKGLDTDVPMKDSDIEWLGEIPEHWIFSSLKWFISIKSGDFLPGEYLDTDKEIPVVGGNGIMSYTDIPNVKKDTIALGRVGALCGNVHLITFNAWITDNALFITNWNNSKLSLKYLYYLLIALDLNKYASQTAQPLITGEIVKSKKIPVPPIEEQQQIVNYIDKETSKIDKLIEKIKQQISNLKKYRQILISNAVTGKIDVREVYQNE